jgi:hypothetical protein
MSLIPIKVQKDLVKFSKECFDVPKVLAWVGHGFDPLDNNDDRVTETRKLMIKYYPHIPYGMNVGNRNSNGTYIPIADEDNDGYYDLNVFWWPEGVYRLNFHSLPNKTENFSVRDSEVSWPKLWEDWDEKTKQEARPFMHRERNGVGYCFRILIKPDRIIEPFGDLDLQ